MWSAGAEIYARVSDLLPAVQLAARSLSREHARLSACVQHYKRQLSQSQIRVTRAQEVQRNARRTIFIDTLLGRDSKVDPAIDQDPYTLFNWLKDADEAGRLSVPTSAALSAATKQSDRDGMCLFVRLVEVHKWLTHLRRSPRVLERFRIMSVG